MSWQNPESRIQSPGGPHPSTLRQPSFQNPESRVRAARTPSSHACAHVRHPCSHAYASHAYAAGRIQNPESRVRAAARTRRPSDSPVSRIQNPESEAARTRPPFDSPVSRIQNPESGRLRSAHTPSPTNRPQFPESRIQSPGGPYPSTLRLQPNFQNPESRVRAAARTPSPTAHSFQNPESRVRAPVDPSTTAQVPESRIQSPGGLSLHQSPPALS
jgi:hypothetical protein